MSDISQLIIKDHQYTYDEEEDVFLDWLAENGIVIDWITAHSVCYHDDLLCDQNLYLIARESDIEAALNAAKVTIDYDENEDGTRTHTIIDLTKLN